MKFFPALLKRRPARAGVVSSWANLSPQGTEGPPTRQSLWLRVYLTCLLIGWAPCIVALVLLRDSWMAGVFIGLLLAGLAVAKVAADYLMWPVEKLRIKLAVKNYGPSASERPEWNGATNVMEIIERVRQGRLDVDGMRLPYELTQIESLSRAGKATELAMESVKRDLFRHLSHQLKSPMALLRAHSEQLEEKRREGQFEQLTEHTAAIEGLTRSVSTLVEHMLSMAWVESLIEKGVLDRKANLSRSLMRMVQARRTLAAERNVTIETSVVAGLWVYGEEPLLQEMFAALLDNAIRYSPEGSTVTVVAEEVGGANAIMVRIVDQGPGVPPSERERVFEPFYGSVGHSKQGDTLFGTRQHRVLDGARERSSHGLGLALVRSVARLHRTDVTLHDGPMGRGLCAQALLVRAEFDDTGDD